MVTCEALLLSLLLAAPSDTVLLDFSASWCGPCRQMEPTVHRLETDGYPVRKIDIDQNRQLASQYRVTGVPCFVMLKDGQEIDRAVGTVSYARLVQMFDKARASRPAAASQVRAQSPEARLMPTDARSDSLAPRRPAANAGRPFETQRPSDSHAATDLAMRATVRIRVADGGGHGCGTGTIIDTHGKEALVVTCGHIFRDSAGKGKIEVDLFADGRTITVPGQVLSYNLERDIGLLTISPNMPVTAARVAPGGYSFAPGSAVFSIGCDHGADPSIRTSRISAIDKYLGPPNIEVAGQPVQGRSGGGLFSQEGLLIGICNAADPQDDEGIYASLPTIHWELDRVGQRRVYDGAPRTQIAGVSRTATPPATQLARATEPPPEMPRQMTDMMPLPPTNQALTTQATRSSDDTEVICIIRSRNGGAPQQRVLVLDQLPVDLLTRLEQAARDNAPANAVAERSTTGRTIRAQSAD